MSDIAAIDVEKELKKNPELKKSDIKYLKEWLKKQPHLPKIADNSLVLFLHTNYYSIEATKIHIDNYYTLRFHVPEIFTNRDPCSSEIRECFNHMAFLPLKGTTKEGYKLLLIKITDPDPSYFVFSQFAKFCYMAIDLWIYLAGCMEGYVFIFDVQEVTLGYVTRIPLGIFKKFAIYLQDGLPVRLKGVHYINLTTGMDAIIRIMKPMLKKHLQDILYTHTTVQTLEKYVPIKYLPNELGGQAGTLMDLQNAQMKYIDEYRDWFLTADLLAQVDESKRPGKAKTESQLFGIQGSFKKLDFD